MTADEAAVRRGAAAATEFRELDKAFDALREGFVTELSTTSVMHTDKILRLHAALQTLTAVRSCIVNVVENGLMARDAIAATGLTRTGQR